MDVTTDDLFDAARAAHERAYCPYSRYPVGVAIRTASGQVFTGCNVENAAYPLGSCAEAGAIAAMVLGGEHRIAEVVVVTDGEAPGTPCGGCRQRLREFAGPDVVVHSATALGGLHTGPVITMTLGELLPVSFGPDVLASRTSPDRT